MNQSEFISQVRAEFGFPADSALDASFFDFESFDSLRMLELVAFIEEIAGLPIGVAPDEYPILETLNDAFDYYLELVGGLGKGPSELTIT